MTKSAKYEKTDLRHWQAKIHKSTRTIGGKKVASHNWSCFFQRDKERKHLSLETPNGEVAAAKARDIYLSLQSSGWKPTLQKYPPKSTKNQTPIPFLHNLHTLPHTLPF